MNAIRKLLLFVALLLGLSAEAATHIYFNVNEFNATPATNRTITVQQTQPVVGNLIFLPATDANGVTYYSNANVGVYNCVIKAPPGNISFQVTVTSTNLGVIDAVTNTSVSGMQTFPTGAAAWSITASDARYARSISNLNIATLTGNGVNVYGGVGSVLGNGTRIEATNIPAGYVVGLTNALTYLTNTGGENWSTFPAVTNVNMASWPLTNVGAIFSEEGISVPVFGIEAYGNGLGLTNLPTPWVTVSPIGLANSQVSVFNNGMDFGPDTPGTTTSGIQEAINSFSKGTNGGANGVYLKFDIGNYFFTNAITYSNNWDYEFVWEGVGKYATRWVYAGTDRGINTVQIKGGGNPSPSLNCSGTVKISDGTFSSILMNTNVLLCITNENEIFLERVHFSGWKTDTAQDWLSTTSGRADQSDYTTTTNGLVGAVLGNVNDAGCYIKNVQAGFLAAGLVLYSDHVRLSDFINPNVGVNVSVQDQTAWPTSHPYRTGAGIIRIPGLDAIYHNVHAYSDRMLFFLLNYPNSNSEIQQFRNVITEGSSPAFVTVITNGNLFTLDAPGENDSAGVWDISNWGKINTNDFSASASIAPVSKRGIVFNDPAYLRGPVADGGVWARTGDFSGSGRGITNLPGITPIPRVARNTNTFTVINSKTFNLDGTWSYNSTSSSYTNGSYPGTAAAVDTISAPPLLFMSFTNSTHPEPDLDYVAACGFSTITNLMIGWVDVNQDPIPLMVGWWSETTNNEAFVEGRLNNLRLPVGAGENATTYVLSGETTFIAKTANVTATLPDIRTNAGRIYFVKADDGVLNTVITTTASQILEGGPITISPGDSYAIQAVDGKWRLISKITYNGATFTNVTSAWMTNGNSSLPVGSFIGTTDNFDVQVKSWSTNLARFSGASNHIIFGTANQITGWQPQSVIGGGRGNYINGRTNSAFHFMLGYNVIAGGATNTINEHPSGTLVGRSFIGGGAFNTISNGGSEAQTIAGGIHNTNAGPHGFIGGGIGNYLRYENIYSNAIGATIPGGAGNTVSGDYGFASGRSNTIRGIASTIPGGTLNSAGGSNAFAQGFKASAAHNGAVVFSDVSSDSAFASGADNEFAVRAAGGLRLTSGRFVGNGGGLTNLAFQTAFATNRHSFTIQNSAAGNASSQTDNLPDENGNSIFYAGTGARSHCYSIPSGGAKYIWGQVPHSATQGKTNCAITQYFITTNVSYFGYSLSANIIDLNSVSNSIVSGNAFSSNDGTTLSVVVAGTNWISVSRVFSVDPIYTNAIWEFTMGTGLTVNPTNNVLWMHADADFY